MRKDNRLEKFFNLTCRSIKIVTSFLFVVYLSIYFLKNRNIEFLWFVVPAVLFIIFLLFNHLLVYFHKKGFYTSKQAVEFYKKCSCQNINIFQDENFEKISDIYFSIFGTDVYLGKETLLTHIEEIYNAGREITEKQ